MPGDFEMTCEHKDFNATVEVHRLTRGEGGEVYAYSADIRIQCKECGLPFEFPGLPGGISSSEARVSIDCQTLNVPLKPSDQKDFNFFTGFNVKHVV